MGEVTYRQIATISKCSAGAVPAELRAMKAEKENALRIETPAEKPVPTDEQKIVPSKLHEPSGEIKLELAS